MKWFHISEPCEYCMKLTFQKDHSVSVRPLWQHLPALLTTPPDQHSASSIPDPACPLLSRELSDPRLLLSGYHPLCFLRCFQLNKQREASKYTNHFIMFGSPYGILELHIVYWNCIICMSKDALLLYAVQIYNMQCILELLSVRG